MGMYTGLVVDCKLNANGMAIIHELNRIHDETEEGWHNAWGQVAEAFPLPWLVDWARRDSDSDTGGSSRQNMIPFGGSAYFQLQDFKEAGLPEDAYRGDDPTNWNHRDLNGDRWMFGCSLKNYGGEIQKFVKDVLPYLCDEIYLCKSRYEESEEWDDHLGDVQRYIEKLKRKAA